MTKFCLLLVLCTLVTEEVFAQGTCATAPDCPLFANLNQGLVTLQDLTQKVQGKHWIMIYYSQFSTTQTYGKCNYRWNVPDSDGNIRRQLMCYNYEMKDCEDFEQKVKRVGDNCNRASENNVTAKLMNAKYYSQDLSQYLWSHSCYEYNAANECTTGYLDLLVSKDRYSDSETSELDLQGLPWHLITADLKNHKNMDISDEKMKFSWKGPECGFDGNVITRSTSSASRREWSVSVLFVIFVLACMF